MSWLGVLAGTIALIGRWAAYLADRQLIGAGEAAAIARGLRDTLERLDLARRVTNALDEPRDDGDRDYAERVRDRFRRPDE